MKFAKYFVVGGLAAVVDIGGFMWLTGALHVHWSAASCASFVTATVVNYVLSVLFVFQSGACFSRHIEIALVFVVSLIGLACNQIVLAVMIGMVGAPHMIAKLAATAAVFFWNYGARRHFVFRSSEPLALSPRSTVRDITATSPFSAESAPAETPHR